MNTKPNAVKTGKSRRFLPGKPPESPAPVETLRYYQNRVLHVLILTALTLGFFAYVPSMWLSIKENLYGVAAFDTAAYCIMLVLFIRKKISYTIRASAVSVLVYLVGLVLLLALGPYGSGPVWLFAFPVLTGVLLGFKAGLASLIVNGVTLVIIGVLLSKGLLPWEYSAANAMAKRIVIFFNFMLLNTLATVSLTSILSGLKTALFQERVLRVSLEEKQKELEDSNLHLQKEISEKELVNEELKASNRRVLLLAENAIDCIWQMDHDLRFTYVNPAVMTIFGFTPQEWIGDRYTRLLSF